MKTPYKLSKDYKKLYQLLSEGYQLAGYVNCLLQTGDYFREIVKIKKSKDFESNVLLIHGHDVNLMEYHHPEKNHESEFELFEKIFLLNNLEFIEP